MPVVAVDDVILVPAVVQVGGCRLGEEPGEWGDAKGDKAWRDVCVEIGR